MLLVLVKLCCDESCSGGLAPTSSKVAKLVAQSSFCIDDHFVSSSKFSSFIDRYNSYTSVKEMVCLKRIFMSHD